MKKGQLRIWWIPQVPGTPFYVPVKDLEQAALIYDTLAEYDAFQYREHIKPDYYNAGGLEEFDGVEWVDWWSEEDATFGDGFQDWLAAQEPAGQPAKDEHDELGRNVDHLSRHESRIATGD